MSYYVSRQMQWPDGQLYVEIAGGGLDYSSPGMLSGDWDGEGEYTDPREAAENAWTLFVKWIGKEPKEDIRISWGYNMDMFVISEDDMTKSKEELDTWAEKEYESLAKCYKCGELVIEEWKWIDHDDYDEDLIFCSENCVEQAHWDWLKENAEKCACCEEPALEEHTIPELEGEIFCSEQCVYSFYEEHLQIQADIKLDAAFG